MGATILDIVLRNLGFYTIRGTVEISTMAVVLVGLLALPYSFLMRGHIIVDLATNWLSPEVNGRIDRFWMCVVALLLAIVAVFMWVATIDLYERGAVSPDLQIPMVVFWIPAATGVTVSVMACLLTAFRHANDEHDGGERAKLD
jgi:TRAP-type C4-dicarboxylate transport system permease small subunit